MRAARPVYCGVKGSDLYRTASESLGGVEAYVGKGTIAGQGGAYFLDELGTGVIANRHTL